MNDDRRPAGRPPVEVTVRASNIRHAIWCDEHFLPHRMEFDLTNVDTGASMGVWSKCDER